MSETKSSYKNLMFTILCILWLGPWDVLSIIVISCVIYGPVDALRNLQVYLSILTDELSEFYTLWKSMEEIQPNLVQETPSSSQKVKSFMISMIPSSWKRT